MLLVEANIGGTVKYVSIDRYALEKFFDAQVASISEIRYAAPTLHGGYVAPTFGDIDFLPSLFTGNWPPPEYFPITLKLGVDGTYANAKTVFNGTASRASFDREGTVYNLFGPQYSDTLKNKKYTGSVIEVFAAQCVTFGLTLDSTAARVISPNVSYQTSGTKLIIESLSEIAAFFSHYFWIDEDNATLYLVDALGDNGTETLTEFDIFPSSYVDQTRYNKFVAGDYTVDGTHTYSEQEYSLSAVCHTVEANVLAALEDIKTIIERPKATLVRPLVDVPAIGKKLNLVDASLLEPTNVAANVSGIVWDFNNEQCIIEGPGVIT